MALHLPRRRFTAVEYHQMVAAGILSEDDRVELIEGEVIEMPPIGWHHAGIVDRLNRLFSRTLGDDVLVHPQNPIHLSDDSEPQPDLALLRPRSDYYTSAGPEPADIFLVVEVSDTTLRYDRQVKMPLYARRGINEAWLIDVNQETVTVYRDPGPTGYGTSQIVRRGERLALLAFPDRTLAVGDILG